MDAYPQQPGTVGGAEVLLHHEGHDHALSGMGETRGGERGRDNEGWGEGEEIMRGGDNVGRGEG